MRQIFPTCSLLSMRRCAALASASSNVLSTTTRTDPADSSGQTLACTSEATAAFDSALQDLR
eukprot:4285048-Pyramimonas_sp.AAC.1